MADGGPLSGYTAHSKNGRWWTGPLSEYIAHRVADGGPDHFQNTLHTVRVTDGGPLSGHTAHSKSGRWWTGPLSEYTAHSKSG